MIQRSQQLASEGQANSPEAQQLHEQMLKMMRKGAGVD
jgi:hypothetical protein